MKKILMRAFMSPLENQTALKVLSNNSVGTNIGNMLFPNSLFRTLTTENTIIDTFRAHRDFTEEDIEIINSEYNSVIFPFANAFRESFLPELRNVTQLVKNLRIPCIVVGIGIQAPLNKTIDNKEIDAVAKDFIKAILEKSTIIGIRGEITAQYLQKLGFREERDFTIIGCPSMYTFGKSLPKTKDLKLNKNSKICINSSIRLPKIFHSFIQKSIAEFPNYEYIPQDIQEIYRMYIGMPWPDNYCQSYPLGFPINFLDQTYQEDKGVSFVNVPTWIEHLKTKDFVFGGRIHGNIASVLAGTPSFIFAPDSRVLELSQYHNIPYMPISNINENTSILDIYESTDFSIVHNGHEQRFLHFLDFLNRNSLEHIYDIHGNAPKVYFDEQINKITLEPELHSFSTIPKKQQLERIEIFLKYYRDKISSLQTENQNYKRKLGIPGRLGLPIKSLI